MWSTCWGEPHWNFAQILGARRLEYLRYRMALFHDMFSQVDITPTRDELTNAWTDTRP